MALSSSSTLQEAIDQYMDNADWDGNPSKARLALQALRIAFAIKPRSQSNDVRNLAWDDLKLEREALQAFVSANTEATGTTNRNFARLKVTYDNT